MPWFFPGLPSLWGSEESALKPFSLGYLKGRARLTSLFALLLSVFEEEVSLDDLKSFCPKLFDSVSVIWVQHMRQNSKEDEVLCNLKLSTRGSLRKAANLIQIAFMVRRLLASGGTDFRLHYFPAKVQPAVCCGSPTSRSQANCTEAPLRKRSQGLLGFFFKVIVFV